MHNFILNFRTSCLRRISAMQRILIMTIVFLENVNLWHTLVGCGWLSRLVTLVRRALRGSGTVVYGHLLGQRRPRPQPPVTPVTLPGRRHRLRPARCPWAACGVAVGTCTLGGRPCVAGEVSRLPAQMVSSPRRSVICTAFHNHLDLYFVPVMLGLGLGLGGCGLVNITALCFVFHWFFVW